MSDNTVLVYVMIGYMIFITIMGAYDMKTKSDCTLAYATSGKSVEDIERICK